MSRSYRKSYFYTACCNSLKDWRSGYNRRFRHIENAKVNHDHDYMCWNSPFKFGYADLWAGPSDGKSRYWDFKESERNDFTRRLFCKFRRHGHSLVHK